MRHKPVILVPNTHYFFLTRSNQHISNNNGIDLFDSECFFIQIFQYIRLQPVQLKFFLQQIHPIHTVLTQSIQNIFVTKSTSWTQL